MNTSVKKQHYASHRRRKITKLTAIYIFLVVISVIWLIPFLYLILQSFALKFESDAFIPQEWSVSGYKILFTSTSYPFWRWWLNTFIIAIATSILQTLITLMTSYALSRLRFRLRKPMMELMLVIGMFPSFLSMVIIYYILDAIGISSSIYSLILVYIASSAMGYYVSKGFFDTIPKSLDEAAMIDGANRNTVFFRIILPLSKPIIVYTLLMGFSSPWGDYMMASYLAQGNQNMFNVAVGLQSMLSKGTMETMFPAFCAGGVLTSIPIMILFFCLQKYYVEGVTGGAVKG